MSCEIDDRDGLIPVRGEMTIHCAQSLAGQLLATADKNLRIDGAAA